jgi:ankyrin repeat protein
MLLKAGADVNSKWNNGRTPLYIAAAQGHEEVLVALLEAGAQMTATDEGRTPLMAATSGGHTSVVAVLRRWIAGTRY